MNFLSLDCFNYHYHRNSQRILSTNYASTKTSQLQVTRFLFWDNLLSKVRFRMTSLRFFLLMSAFQWCKEFWFVVITILSPLLIFFHHFLHETIRMGYFSKLENSKHTQKNNSLLFLISNKNIDNRWDILEYHRRTTSSSWSDRWGI